MRWQTPKTFPILKTNQVHIWRVSLERSKKESKELFGLLNVQEKNRAGIFLHEKAKNSFIIARGILRLLLSKYLNIEPQKIIFKQNKYGKLFLKASYIQFNISHSGDLALFIFTLKHQVGVDVELVRNNFDFLSVAKKVFSKKEYADLVAISKNKQLHAFFNCWSRKEAFIKAIGKGVFCELNKFSVEVSNKKNGKIKLGVVKNFDTKKLSLYALNPADDYTAAFAVLYGKCTAKFYVF